MSAILTIAIPTYRRAAELRTQLERLVPQLVPEVRLCVFDNASPDETRAVVAEYLHRGVNYAGAAVNCGWGRNFFRCFEECQTEWLWMLSDDDFVTPTAVADLLNLLRSETADFYHTSHWDRVYSKKIEVSDLESLLKHAKCFGDLLWISAGIYRISTFRPFFRTFNDAMTTWGPHLAIIISSVELQKCKVCLTPICLVTPKTFLPAWSALDFLLRFTLLPEFLSCAHNQRLVAEMIFRENFATYLLIGLRETGTPNGVAKWQRIKKQVSVNLKAYDARGNVDYVLRNWFRSGHRRQCWWLAKQCLQIELLAWCPARWFHVVARLLPLADDVRKNYNKRAGYVPYG